MSALPASSPTHSGVGSAPSPKVRRLVIIDYLRGVAILLVCFCHYYRSLPEPIRPYAVEIGRTGVQIFFVISGFIIPYGLHRSGYRLTAVFRFYVKRLLRLQPPYLAGLALFFLISTVAALAKHTQTAWGWKELLKAAVYQWVPPENPVFWTLIVELKYYVFVSLAFPLFFGGPRWLGTVAIGVGAGCIYWFVRDVPLLQHAPYFLLGFAACRQMVGLAHPGETAVLILAVLASGYASSTPVELIAGTLTTLIILAEPVFESRVLAYFGTISYSLYLVHFPVGVKIINLLDEATPTAWKFLLGILALGLAIAAAQLIYHVAEVPATNWSQAFKLTRKPRGAAASLPA